MAIDALVKEREKNLKVLRRNSQAVKAMIYLTMAIPLIVNVARVGVALGRGTIGSVITNAVDLCLAMTFMVSFLVHWHRFNHPQSTDSSVIPAPSEIEGDIKRDLLDFAATLHVSTENIQILVSRRDLTSAPSMVELRGKLSLIIPLGFLKVRKTDPAPALAMLKHELAHAEQRDTQMWALSAVYWKIYMRWYFPLVLAIFLFNLAGLALVVLHNQSVSSRIADGAARAHAVNDENYKQRMRLTDSIAKEDGGRQFNDRMDAEFRKMSIDLQIDVQANKELSAETRDVLPSAISCTVGSLYVIFLLISFGAVRSLRRLSEHMADLAVIICGDGTALQTALSQFCTSGRRFRVFALHPSDKSRLVWIQTRLQRLQFKH